ncbi:GHKL domain-containing protein [Blautia wexlerae]|nr:GHKL domain-containing protein [Blautia wexlerae]
MLGKRKSRKYNAVRSRYSFILGIGSLVILRMMANGAELHIVYNYVSIIITVMIIGHFLFRYSIKYCLLLGSVFLSVILLGQLISCIFFYRYSSDGILADLSEKYQIYMILIAEIVIIIGNLVIKKIVNKIPLLLSGLNVVTIIIPLFINIVVMAICADQLYNDKRMIVDNVWSIITIIAVCIVVFMGTVCNIVVLENYLNVKKIENEKNLQISEMSLQYDYYMKQSNDMENIRKISHDIKNHLESLRGNVDYQQKQEYIDGIESKLDIYQSYYKTGNAFLDNLLHAKRLEALEKKIEFKVFADFTPFKRVKNEDLCVIVSNTIDNALRECQLMKADNPKIECLVQLKARKIKGFLSIICENSLRESQAEALRGNSVMETSKEDKKNHGFGVKNIKHVVREYGGEVSFNVVDDMFSVSILIPIEV